MFDQVFLALAIKEFPTYFRKVPGNDSTSTREVLALGKVLEEYAGPGKELKALDRPTPTISKKYGKHSGAKGAGEKKRVV